VGLGMHVSLGARQEGMFFLLKGDWVVSELRGEPKQDTVLGEKMSLCS
jgi:hypothetical protein